MKAFSIGNDRSLKLNKSNSEITIADKGTKTAAVFTRARWALIRLCIDQIDGQLSDLAQDKDVSYCAHYGGGWHVSMTKGFRYVDLRKFYMPKGEIIWKPTSTGIALRLAEWSTLKEFINSLHRDNPDIIVTPCFFNHGTPEIIAACPECNPSHSTTV